VPLNVSLLAAVMMMDGFYEIILSTKNPRKCSRRCWIELFWFFAFCEVPSLSFSRFPIGHAARAFFFFPPALALTRDEPCMVDSDLTRKYVPTKYRVKDI
jgi:hypothetical protein